MSEARKRKVTTSDSTAAGTGTPTKPQATKKSSGAWFQFVADHEQRVKLIGTVKQEFRLRFPASLTPDELAQYNGSNPELPIYLAIAGEIYDVTDGRSHYGPEGGYAGFAGRDATKSFFDLCFTDECLAVAHDLSTLTEKQQKELSGWVDFYKNEPRYPFVGYVKRD